MPKQTRQQSKQRLLLALFLEQSCAAMPARGQCANHPPFLLQQIKIHLRQDRLPSELGSIQFVPVHLFRKSYALPARIQKLIKHIFSTFFSITTNPCFIVKNILLLGLSSSSSL